MYPEIFGISTYWLMSLVGVLAAFFYACRAYKKRGYNDNTALITLIVGAAGTIVGAHLLFGLVNTKLSSDGIIETFSGMVFYGGLYVGSLCGALYLKRLGAPAEYYDLIVPAIPLFHGFARIGCFFNGCCWGEIFGFPVQLSEAIFELCLFALLVFIKKPAFLKGRLFWLYAALYAVGRFVLEFFREDIARGSYGLFTTSQWIALASFAVCTALTVHWLRLGREKQ